MCPCFGIEIYGDPDLLAVMLCYFSAVMSCIVTVICSKSLQLQRHRGPVAVCFTFGNCLEFHSIAADLPSVPIKWKTVRFFGGFF